LPIASTVLGLELHLLVECCVKEHLNALLKLAARQHDPPAASEAPQPNISADPRDFPVGASAGMLFAQAYPVPYVDVYDVSGHSVTLRG